MRCRFITRRIVSSMLILHNKLHAVLFATLFSVCGSLMAADKVDSLLSKAQSYLNNGQAEQAYQLLIANELEYAGNTDYDYWLGVSSLAAGQYIMATLAYERVLIITPENLSARFDMGLAYLRMGNNERALQEFERVKQANPQRNIRVLLDEAIAQARVDKTQLTLAERLSGAVSMKVGYDSNLNYSVSEDRLPYLAGLTKYEDFFGKIDAELSYQKPLSSDSQLEFRAFGYTMQPFNESQFASIDANGSVAYQYFFDGQRVEAGLTVGDSWLDGEEYFTKTGGWLGWRKSLDKNSLLDITGLFNRIRYEQAAVESFDYDQALLSTRLITRLPGKPIVGNVGFIGGIDDAVDPATRDGDKHVLGVSFGLQGDVSFASSAYFNMAFTKNNYQKRSFSFGTFTSDYREDKRLDFTAGLIWQLDKDSAVIAELELNQNNSNQTEYSYDRSMVGISFKTSFGD